MLTQETVQYLKKPTFDIWHWEPNEMLCLMEHMFHELGIVTELHINPITRRRWLVSEGGREGEEMGGEGEVVGGREEGRREGEEGRGEGVCIHAIVEASLNS